MIESVDNNMWLYIIGILSGIIVVKNVYCEIILPIARKIGFEINSKESKELKIVHEKLDKIDERLHKSEIAREEQKELQGLILEGVTASLRAHQINGANGSVSGTLVKIDEYKTMKAVM